MTRRRRIVQDTRPFRREHFFSQKGGYWVCEYCGLAVTGDKLHKISLICPGPKAKLKEGAK